MWAKERWPDWEIYVEEGCRCAYCGLDGTQLSAWRNLEVDHIVPRRKGGSDNRINKTVSCKACNLAKASFDPSERSASEPSPDTRAEFIEKARNYIFFNDDFEKAAFEEMMQEVRTGAYTSTVNM